MDTPGVENDATGADARRSATDVALRPVDERRLSAVSSQPGAMLFGTDDPAGVIKQATRVSKMLTRVVEDRKLYVDINQGRHLKIEAWNLLGSMLGVAVVPESVEGLRDGQGKFVGFKARSLAQLRDGTIVGAAFGVCDRSEPRWKDKPNYALMSMAQTRANSRALAASLRFVVVLAGFNPTPAEEEARESMVDVAAVRDVIDEPSPWCERCEGSRMELIPNPQGGAYLKCPACSHQTAPTQAMRDAMRGHKGKGT